MVRDRVRIRIRVRIMISIFAVLPFYSTLVAACILLVIGAI